MLCTYTNPYFTLVFLSSLLTLLRRHIEHKQATDAYRALLRETAAVTATARWSETREQLMGDPRFSGVTPDERESLFRAYVRELAEQEERTQRDEQRRRQEREREERDRQMQLQRQRTELPSRFEMILRGL